MALQKDRIWIFTDGASSGNPGPSGWGAIIRYPDDQIVELGGGESRATNNRMELLAAARSITEARVRAGLTGEQKLDATVLSDSTYLINGITKWGFKWQRNGWPADLANRELWIELWGIRNGIDWRHIRAHSGIAGNERVDAIAVGFSKGRAPELFRGSRVDYSVAIENLQGSADSALESRPAGQPSARTSAGMVYLSLVDGNVERHSDWKSCEARVKGRSGARFQKAGSIEEQTEILSRWGVTPPWEE